jgi:inorganic pyrophosphatase
VAGNLTHYFFSYKIMPGEESSVSIPNVYGSEHAWAVVEAATEDHRQAFGETRA